LERQQWRKVLPVMAPNFQSYTTWYSLPREIHHICSFICSFCVCLQNTSVDIFVKPVQIQDTDVTVVSLML